MAGDVEMAVFCGGLVGFFGTELEKGTPKKQQGGYLNGKKQLFFWGGGSLVSHDDFFYTYN